MEIEYKHWEDYYKNEYSEIYNREYEICYSIIKKYDGDASKIIASAFDFEPEKDTVSINLNESNAGKLIFKAKDLFYASCDLLRLFLCNNGNFQTRTYSILKQAFNINFLPDGDDWIELFKIFKVEKILNLDYVISFIVNHLYVFENLNNQFKNEFEHKTEISRTYTQLPDAQADTTLYFEIVTFKEITAFNDKYKIFHDVYENFALSQAKKKPSLYDVFTALYNAFVFYYKFLKILLKKEGINVFLPKDIIRLAHEKNIINNGDCWISYIEHMNVYYEKFQTDEKNEIMQQTIKDFKPAIESAYSFVNNEYKNFIENFKPNYDEIQKVGIDLADNKPLYDYKDLRISKKSYNIIMDFFRSQKELKKAWLHGSRARGTSMPSSNLDIIVDYPENLYKDFFIAFKKLNIPYIIECSNVNNKSDLIYIKDSQIICTKKIYCSDDFV